MSLLSRRVSAVVVMLRAVVAGLGARAFGRSGAPAGGRARRVGLLVSAVVAGVLWLDASPALALNTHVFSTSFGAASSTPANPYPLSAPSSVAVDDSTGAVYVADPGKDWVEKFDSSGNLVWIAGGGVDQTHPGNLCTIALGDTCQAGTAGTGAGQFRTPTFVAVDNSGGASAGDVYVGDTGDNLVTKLTSSGSVVSTWGASGQLNGSTATGGPFTSIAGIATDTTGNLFVHDPNTEDWFEFAQDGTAQPTISVSRGTNNVGIAVDANGNFYKVVGNGNLEQFNSSGSDIGDVTDDQNPGPITGFAVDPTSNDVYAVDGGGSIRHYAGSSLSTCVSATNCAAADTFGASRLVGATGVAINPVSGTVFVVNGDWVDLFTGPVQVPNVTASAASGIGHNSATLNGSVDPAGAGNVTSCAFEYVDDADFQLSRYASATTVPCSQATPITSPTNVSANVSGLTAGTTYHFQVVASNANGQGSSYDQTLQDETLSTPPAVAGLSTDPASNIGATTATVNGSLDPAGQDTTYHFQYTTSADFQANGYANATSVPVPDADAGSTPGEASVTPVNITGLTPGTSYTYRIVATDTFGSTDGNDQPFSTPPPPSIDSASATNLTTTTADLNAQINPNGTDTTYHFQYGTSTSYGTSFPVPDAEIGSGGSDVPVTQQITGLTANTEYHWRVVATNPSGVTRGVDHSFIYATTGQGLPDNRGYEMVTPPQKNGSLIGNFVFGPAPSISADGSRAVIEAIQCFGDASSCNTSVDVNPSPFAFTRTSTGWVSTALAPPATQFTQSQVGQVSADAGTALFAAGASTGAGEGDWVAREANGSLVDIGPGTPPADGAETYNAFILGQAATADLSHVVWLQQSGQVPFWPFDATTGISSVYEYAGSGNSQPALAGVSGGPGSTDLISRCATSFGAPGPADAEGVQGRLSADGATVYFTATPCAGGSGANAATPVPAYQLYARVDGTLADAHTVPISQRSPVDCTSSACLSSPTGDAVLEGASADGSMAYFTSTQQLTDSASEDSSDSAFDGNIPDCNTIASANGCNLYLYDFGKPSGHQLTAVSAGDTSGGGPRVRGVVAISQDGSHVYFVAQGVLSTVANAQGQVARTGAENLYVHDAGTGQTAFVADLPASDANEWIDNGAGDSSFSQGTRAANVTPDGRFLVFLSHGNLTADDTSASGANQVFRYDAQTGQLIRLSIGNDGFGDNGNRPTATPCSTTNCSEDARLSAPDFFQEPLGDPTMSDAGTRVFFTSPVALAAHALDDVQIATDTTGDPVYAQNVYEWEQAGVGSCPAGQSSGCVYLISDGRDLAVLNGAFSDVQLYGSDRTGDNVFFTTSDRLVPQDTDTESDVYDARVGGGFPFTPPAAGCSGDTCQGSPGAPPSAAVIVTFDSGPGNQAAGVTARAKVRVSSRPVKGRVFSLTVEVPGRGRVTVSGRGVNRVSKSVNRAGSYRLRVVLTSKQWRALKHKRKLRLTLRVAYAPAGGPAAHVTVSITDRA